MQRTIRLLLKPNDQEALALWQTVEQYTWSFNAVCTYGWEQSLTNGVELHKATYYEHRMETGLPSQLICAARVKAAEALKSAKALKNKGGTVNCPSSKHCPLRYDARSYTVWFDRQELTILAIGGRIKLSFEIAPYSKPLQPTDIPSKKSATFLISAGEKVLIPSDATPDKQVGVKAIASGNCSEAVSKLEAALKSARNDPETLIYLNNARIGNQQSYLIAASVPIGSDTNGAKEILRGVAQAQNEIDQASGIKYVPLKVLIADGNNDPGVAKQVAAKFVENSKVLGVMGHYASDVTLATANIYQEKLGTQRDCLIWFF